MTFRRDSRFLQASLSTWTLKFLGLTSSLWPWIVAGWGPWDACVSSSTNSAPSSQEGTLLSCCGSRPGASLDFSRTISGAGSHWLNSACQFWMVLIGTMQRTWRPEIDGTNPVQSMHNVHGIFVLSAILHRKKSMTFGELKPNGRVNSDELWCLDVEQRDHSYFVLLLRLNSASAYERLS